VGKIYPEEYRREAIELYRLGGITYAAVGRKLGVSGEAVRAGQRIGRRPLRGRLRAPSGLASRRGTGS